MQFNKPGTTRNENEACVAKKKNHEPPFPLRVMKIPSLLTASFSSLGAKLSLLLAAPLFLIPVGRVSAQTFTSLHSFNLIDGVYPYDGLILSGSTLYGTTNEGGTSENALCGTVFSEVPPSF